MARKTTKPTPPVPPPPAGKAPALGVLEVQRMAVSAINAAPYNPRVALKPGDPEYEKLKRSLTEFGCADPPIWNRRTGHLVGGHQRFRVMCDLGVTEIDVSVVDLDLPREKALNVALNKITGRWDDAALGDLLADLQAGGELDVTLSGFDDAEIDEVIEKAAAAAAAAMDAEGEAGGGAGTGGSGGGKRSAEEFGVLVQCRSEGQQRRIFDQMTKRGLKCKVLTL